MTASDAHHRRSIRLKQFDYASAAAYFVTICAYERRLLFEPLGVQTVIATGWRDLPHHHRGLELDAFVIMPNHLHFVVFVGETASAGGPGAQQAAPLQVRATGRPGVASGSLGSIVRSFKARVTRDLRRDGWPESNPVWQRNYYEHVICNERDLTRVRKYIADNPARWHADRDNPDGMPDADERDFWFDLGARLP